MINPLGILQCSVWARVEGRAVRILPRQPLDPASTQLPGTVEGGGGTGQVVLDAGWLRVFLGWGYTGCWQGNHDMHFHALGTFSCLTTES